MKVKEFENGHAATRRFIFVLNAMAMKEKDKERRQNILDYIKEIEAVLERWKFMRL